MTDSERLDWLADQMPFDGFAGLDLHDLATERMRIFLSDDPTEDEREAEERAAYRWALRELIDRASVIPSEGGETQ